MVALLGSSLMRSVQIQFVAQRSVLRLNLLVETVTFLPSVCPFPLSSIQSCPRVQSFPPLGQIAQQHCNCRSAATADDDGDGDDDDDDK